MATPELTMTDWDVSRRTPFDFAGRVQISIESQPVAEFEIDAQRTRQCNWLQTQGIPVGFISERPSLHELSGPSTVPHAWIDPPYHVYISAYAGHKRLDLDDVA